MNGVDKKIAKAIGLNIALVIAILIVWHASSIFLLAFASILFAIFLNAVGRGAKKLTRLPYPLALALALVLIAGFLTLTFWLYSPLIADQFALLTKQLPQAYESLRSSLVPYIGIDLLAQERLTKEFSFSNQTWMSQLLSVFSTTLGSIAAFVVFLIVGLYLAFDPTRYVKWIVLLLPEGKQGKTRKVMDQIGKSLRWWILGKLLSMAVVGISTFIGLSILHVPLALILGFLAGLLTFIPYVGAILASIPAILIAFAQSPWSALYVTILYVAVHVADGYFITPSIEQRTASIPPAFTILAQALMVVLLGGIGLALATPLVVVVIAVIVVNRPVSTLKMGEQPQKSHDN